MMADIQLKSGVESEFKQWFSEVNQVLSKFDGFVSRRLLQSGDGSYRILVEHQSKETFVKMHNSPEHEKIAQRLPEFFAAEPQRKSFTIAAE